MIAKLKRFLQSHIQAISPEEKAHQLKLAAASMLLEVVFADETLAAEERTLLPKLLTETLSMSVQDANDLIEEAKKVQGNATSLFEFTNTINAEFSLEQKQQLLLAMWQLAYADGQLSQYEDQIIRRTADLLYLKHSELIQMRNQAINAS
ncbi:TerB family tellurite resistance protein [Shewanella xiamenensis]|uniref:TerB family tellurite resistance protein n=1 Tax=Shewanella cutis TaxID=2766780 RepID=A0ABS9R1C4_9GAMM|nr:MULTISPECIES: TerB family tellurite resistance protein [Shewanella]MCG9966396.1 TerB family tellurite resistance protein [Shewanella sp. PS-2]MCR4536486.1 TerB family tellurite resistance protein [Shewanella xiamenensis]WHF55514.1 TerB family tellurite resistance protein [Shewanella xiamenensis]